MPDLHNNVLKYQVALAVRCARLSALFASDKRLLAPPRPGYTSLTNQVLLSRIPTAANQGSSLLEYPIGGSIDPGLFLRPPDPAS